MQTVINRLLLISLAVGFSFYGFSQSDQRPSRSRFYNAKFSTFSVTAGDILVYEVKNNDSIYNYVVTIKKFSPDINFDYAVPQQQLSGSITIEAKAVAEAVKYDTLTSGKQNLTDKSIFWLSQKNYSELFDDKTTTMNFGDSAETFERKSISTTRVNYKGKEKIVTIYNVQSTGKSPKNLAILTTKTNPLILKMDTNTTLTLKEVR